MLTFRSHEVKIIRDWAEKAEGSPFPQEINVLSRIKRVPAGASLTLTRREIEVVYHWAEQDSSSHRGTERYLLEAEFDLFRKIETYLE